MAEFNKDTKKKFLDYEGLEKVFELLKNKYGVDIEALKKLVGSWSKASEETVIGAIEAIREQIGEWDVEDLDTIAQAVASLNTRIDDLDYEGVESGSVITQVTQEDGKVTATAANLTSADKTVIVDGLDLAVNIDGDTIVKDTDGKIGVSSTALAIEGEDAIDVEVSETGKTVKLNIASGDKVLTQSEAGLLANLELKYTPKSDTENGKIELIGKDNTVISTFDTADFTVDGFLKSVAWKGDGSNDLVFTWNTDAGVTVTEIDLTKYIDTYTNGDGLNLDDKEFSVKVKDDDKYLTVDENGVASKGIDEAIAAAVDALDAEVTSTDGEFVTVKVTEVDGKVTAVNVSEEDIASDTELQAEIAARKEVTGIDADEYTANEDANYISGADSLNAADVALDGALKDIADKVAAIETDYIKYENLQPISITEIEELFNGTGE